MGFVKVSENRTDELEWACAAEMLSGQVECGDRAVVEPFEGGALLAVIDGIGHGREAALAAEIAANLLKSKARDSVISLIQSSHDRLRSTRGVVMTLASINAVDHTLTWIGVGNVAGSLHSKSGEGHASVESVVLRGGMVGVQLPPLRAEVLPLRQGDLLIFATDGVYAGMSLGVKLDEPVGAISERMLRDYSKGQDDALVLVARYFGGSQ